MKKTVIIILAILPIFLVVTISFAGKILSLYQHIAVERVEFVDESNIKYEDNFVLVVNVGGQAQTKVRVYPDLATNKKVTYSSNDENICTVDSAGIVTGITFGTTSISVKTEEGGKVAILLIKVTQDKVTGVSFPYEEIELNVGESKIITAQVEPYVALNKSVKYSSSNTSVVQVDANGLITAIGVGEATIMVITEDGGYTDTCLVIISQGTPVLCFDFSNDENFIESGSGYIVNINKINLLNYLQFDEKKVKIEEINFRIKFGSKIATLNNDELTITGKGVITIVAFVGDKDDPTYQIELRLMIQ